MILTVSTVRDTLQNVERFVQRNCSQGVDHMVIFLDGRQPDLVSMLQQDPRVTVIPTLDAWWTPGERPGALNARQGLNASAVNCVLAEHAWATWLFPIDGDEVLHLNRHELESLGPSARAVRLQVLESLSSDDEADAGWFKRALSRSEEIQAREHGLIGRTRDPAYFHGHTRKSGIRPDLGVQLRIHGARVDSGEKVPAIELGSAKLLHFESSDFPEFVRKWRSLTRAGIRTLKLRPERRELAEAYEAATAANLGATELERSLRSIYRDFVEDAHGQALRELGLLEHVEVDAPRLAPRQIDPASLRQVRRTLESLARVDKRALFAGPLTVRRDMMNAAIA